MARIRVSRPPHQLGFAAARSAPLAGGSNVPLPTGGTLLLRHTFPPSIPPRGREASFPPTGGTCPGLEECAEAGLGNKGENTVASPKQLP